MSEQYRYRLQRKEPYSMPNILGNHSMPVNTYRWKDIAVSGDFEELKSIYRIVPIIELLMYSMRAVLKVKFLDNNHLLTNKNKYAIM